MPDTGLSQFSIWDHSCFYQAWGRERKISRNFVLFLQYYTTS